MCSGVIEKEEMMLIEESPLRYFPREENCRHKDKFVLLQCVVQKIRDRKKRLVRSGYKNVNFRLELETET